jgi:tetratricopeptide (TPR) repeat protein
MHSDVPVERFDELFQGDPAEIEQRLLELRPKSLVHPDASLTPQIDSQIALVQAMQQRWDDAVATLERAERLPGADLPVARVRLLLERGRVFHQARRMAEALPWMIASYELSRSNGLDYHGVNAAHMAAIVAEEPAAKIQWNQIAIELAKTTADEKVKAWLVVLHNNIGQAYIAAGRFKDALAAFQQCRRLAAQQGNAVLERGARWGIARAQRSLGNVADALSSQQQLLKEYDDIQCEGSLPTELIGMARGMVYEELAELMPAKSADFAAMALLDLGVNHWFRELEPVRWSRIQQLASGASSDVAR